MRKQTCIILAISCLGTSAYAADCNFWGDFAGVAHGDYTARLEVGEPNALAQTAEVLDYPYSTPGSMEHVYLSAVLGALKAGRSRDAVSDIGRDVCLSYPAGTFDPDALE